MCKIHDISDSKNTTCKLCKKPKKSCNENNCYTTASFNFRIGDRPIKCMNHEEKDMINVKRKYIASDKSKILYKKDIFVRIIKKVVVSRIIKLKTLLKKKFKN